MNDTAELTFRDVANAATADAAALLKFAPEVAAEVVDRADINNGRAVVRYSATEQALAALRERYAGATFDLTTTRGDAAARAARLELTKLRTALEARRKEFKAPALDFGKLIDSEAARITAEIRKLEDPIDAAIKADEDRREREREAKRQAEAARVAKHRASIEVVKQYAQQAQAPGMTAARITRGIVALSEMTFGPEFEEFRDEIAQARDDTVLVLEDLRAKAVAREEEAARLEQQRLENERVAAENARVAAELKRQADELAAQQKADAERRQAEARAMAAADVGVVAAPGQYPATEYSEGQDSQQVLKAEPATADATDRDAPADASPRVGAMGAGQAADAAPVEEQEIPTLSLSQIADRLGFVVTAKLLEGLGFTAHAVKASRLYRPSDFPAICDALIAHIQKARAA